MMRLHVLPPLYRLAGREGLWIVTAPRHWSVVHARAALMHPHPVIYLRQVARRWFVLYEETGRSHTCTRRADIESLGRWCVPDTEEDQHADQNHPEGPRRAPLPTGR